MKIGFKSKKDVRFHAHCSSWLFVFDVVVIYNRIWPYIVGCNRKFSYKVCNIAQKSRDRSLARHIDDHDLISTFVIK